jgi:hypothetical protein
VPPVPPGTPDELAVTSVDFRPRITNLTVEAGVPEVLRVQVQPPGVHEVRFALLAGARDAILSDSVKMSNELGEAETTVTAFSASSNFAVRAAAGEHQDIINIVPLPARGGTLIIEPQYFGERSIQRWEASVHVGKTCMEIASFPYPNSATSASASFAAGVVRLDRVDANTNLAVLIRAEQFAGGCRNISAVRANSETLVVIDVTDRPLQLTDLNLALQFGIEATEGLHPALDELAFRAVIPLTGEANDDLAALLDVMSANSNNPGAFELARSERNWRDVLASNLDAELLGSGLRTMLHDWMRDGLRRLSEPNALRGLLGAPADGVAPLALTTVTDLTPEAAGFTASNVASFSAGADDQLRLDITLDFRPSPLLAASATGAALLENPASTSVRDAMSERFGCGNVANLLVNAGDGNEAFPDCDEVCMLDLCRAGMADLWQRVVNSNLPSVAWQIAGTSRAQIDPDARPVSISGVWIGSLAVEGLGDEQRAIGGAFAGAR